MLFWLAGFAGRALASQSVELTWTPSTSGDVVAYQVFYGTQSGVYPNSITFGNVSDVIVPSLVDGTRYYFAVAAINSQNYESARSHQIVYTTPAAAAIELQAQDDTDAIQAVALFWTASDDSDVYGYQVNYGTQSGNYTNSVTCYETTNTVISDLAGGVTYYFSVSPIDSLGVEAVASQEVSYTVPVPETLTLQAQMAVGTAGVELTWNAIANEGIASYYVYYGTQSGNYGSSINAGDVTDFVVRGLVPGQICYFAVAPVDAYGNQGPLSNEASSPAAAPAPVQVQVQTSSAAMQAVDVSWTASSDPDVDGYAVNYWTAADGYTNSQDFYYTTDATIYGLTPGATYYFSIAPIGSMGVEPIASGQVSSTIPVPQPITLQASAVAGLPSVELTWSALPNEGVVGYNIYYGTQSGSYSYSASCGTESGILIQDLSGDEVYYFAVAAVDAYGNQSPLSNEASAKTVAPPPVRLTTQTYYNNGQPYLLEINTPSTVAGPWEIDSSSDLQNWSYCTSGYGNGNGDGYDVDAYVSLDPTVPQMFFRLRH